MKKLHDHIFDRMYIENFCEDLNYRKLILYVKDVSLKRLREHLEKDYVNKIYRFDYILDKSGDASKRYFMYIENCDLQDLDYPVADYIIEEGYMIATLHEDEAGFYIENPLY